MNLQAIRELFIPNVQRCFVCETGTAIIDYGSICETCLRSAPWIVRQACSICGRPVHCPDCPRRTDTYFTLHRSAVRYTSQMKEWLGAYKYAGDERFAAVLSWMMLSGVAQLVEALYGTYIYKRKAFDMITYVPIDPHRLAQRGFNQSEQLARLLANELRLPTQATLHKVQTTLQQSKMSRSERIRHLQGAFVPSRYWVERSIHMNNYRRPSSVNRRPLRVLLVDDVYTTGSTLNECARVLTATFPCRVYGLTWARS